MTGLLVAGACAVLAWTTGRRARTVDVRARAEALRSDSRAGRASSPPRPSPIALGWIGRLEAARRSREDRRALERDLPGLVELLRVGVSAGLTPAAALRRAPGFVETMVGRALEPALGAMDAGLTLSEALDVAVDEHPALAPLAGTLAATADLGAGVSDALGRLGAELRGESRRRAEARARTVPVRLLFPLVFAVLPAFLLLGVAPGILAGLAA